jgi:hypothetical protein
LHAAIRRVDAMCRSEIHDPPARLWISPAA